MRCLQSFWSKIGHFSIFLFQVIQPRKMCFTIFQNEKTPCLGYKNKQFKKSKNYDFCKGFSLWFWSKIGHFSNVLFQAIQARKFCFTLFQNEKNPFQAIKTKSSKSRQIKMFANRLVHFSPKPKSNQNHGQTPLEKFLFVHFFNFLYLQPRKAFFRFRIS